MLGFLFVSLIMWDRLIRVRLPRGIPLILTELSVILICVTCILLIITIKIGTTIKGNNITMFPLRSILQFIHYILNLRLFKKDEINYRTKNIIKWLYENKKILRYIVIFMKFLRSMMTLLFAYEVFILHQIKIFYIFFPLLLLPLLCSFFIYYLSDLYETQSDFIDERVEIHCSTKRAEECIYVENYYKIIKAREWI